MARSASDKFPCQLLRNSIRELGRKRRPRSWMPNWWSLWPTKFLWTRYVASHDLSSGPVESKLDWKHQKINFSVSICIEILEIENHMRRSGLSLITTGSVLGGINPCGTLHNGPDKMLSYWASSNGFRSVTTGQLFRKFEQIFHGFAEETAGDQDSKDRSGIHKCIFNVSSELMVSLKGSNWKSE